MRVLRCRLFSAETACARLCNRTADTQAQTPLPSGRYTAVDRSLSGRVLLQIISLAGLQAPGPALSTGAQVKCARSSSALIRPPALQEGGRFTQTGAVRAATAFFLALPPLSLH